MHCSLVNPGGIEFDGHRHRALNLGDEAFMLACNYRKPFIPYLCLCYDRSVSIADGLIEASLLFKILSISPAPVFTPRARGTSSVISLNRAC